MSMARTIIGGHSNGLYVNKPAVCCQKRSQTLLWSPVSKMEPSRNVNIESSLKNQLWLGNFSSSSSRVLQIENKSAKRNLVVYNNVPGAPSSVPSGPPSNSLNWIIGILVSFILPLMTNKWGPLWVLRNKVLTKVQTIEDIADVVEKVAEKVDKVAENLVHELPEGSKLRAFAGVVEKMAENVDKTAESLGDIIDKVQEAEENVACAVAKSMNHEAENKSPTAEEEEQQK